MRYLGLFALFFTLSVLALGSGSALAAPAEGAILFVAPHRLTVLHNDKVSILNIANKSKTPRRYDLTIVDQVMGKNGVTELKDTFEYSAKRMVKFMPKRFSLQPGERQTVRVMISRPADLPDGDYHSHLLFREVPLNVKDKAQLEAERKEASAQKTVSFEIRALYGIGVPIVIQNGKIVSDLSLGEVKLGRTGDGKQRQMSIDFLRTGNAEATARLRMEYVQPGKEPVAVIDQQWIRLYREVDTVSKDFPLINIPEGAQGGKIVISLFKNETSDSEAVKKEVAFN